MSKHGPKNSESNIIDTPHTPGYPLVVYCEPPRLAKKTLTFMFTCSAIGAAAVSTAPLGGQEYILASAFILLPITALGLDKVLQNLQRSKKFTSPKSI